MSTVYSRLMSRFRQESTWRGLVALAAALGGTLEPQRAEQFILGALAIIGLINAVKDK